MRLEPIPGRERIETTEVPSGPGSPRLLDRVGMATRALHSSLRTEEAYVGWVGRTRAAARRGPTRRHRPASPGIGRADGSVLGRVGGGEPNEALQRTRLRRAAEFGR